MSPRVLSVSPSGPRKPATLGLALLATLEELVTQEGSGSGRPRAPTRRCTMW